jgi:transcriptional regulator PpsR
MAQAASAPLSKAQPDITLVLDMEGVIQEATLSAAIPNQDLRDWIGRPWLETVVNPGASKVQRIVEDARTLGVSAFRQINQRFPNGLELPFEYTAFRSERKGLIAVGKCLQAVAELQAKLIAAQQAIERDYWKLREIETRCRLLFDRSNEAVLLVRAANLRVVEANPMAMRALDLSAAPDAGRGAELLPQVAAEERSVLETMLHRVRDQGKAPGILVHLGRERRPWLVRASLLPSQEGLAYLLQLTSAAGEIQGEAHDLIPLDRLVERSPDGFVVVDAQGTLLRANRAFLDLVQVGDESSVVGERIGRWLGRPGADVALLLTNVGRHGAVRLFATALHGELGTSTEVEVAAAGDVPDEPRYVGMQIRDVASRLPATAEGGQLGAMLGAFADQVGKTSLPVLVRETVAAVERHYIKAALEMTAGNRTAAAQLLGVSRQSLYAKLGRYGSEGGGPTGQPDE